MKKPSEKEKAIAYYKNICKVKAIGATPIPITHLCIVLNMSLKGEEKPFRVQEVIRKNHLSFLEFIDITFKIEPVTTSFLKQITRHRHASFMSSSYHYKEAKKGDWIVPYAKDKRIKEYFLQSNLFYKELLAKGTLKEEARNILPQAITHSLLMKINARSLFNFFNLRLCKRNIPEMIAIAEQMYNLCMSWCPEVFSLIGTDCKLNQCKQGKMRSELCE